MYNLEVIHVSTSSDVFSIDTEDIVCAYVVLFFFFKEEEKEKLKFDRIE